MDSATNITINIVEPGSDVPVPDTGLFTHGIGGTEASIIATVGIVIIIAIAAIILYLRKKKINLKPSKHTSIILSILAIITSIATFTGLTLNSIYNHTNAKEGDLTVAAEDTNLTIEVGNQPVFAVLPVQVTVEEATQAGYTLTAYTDNTDLVSTTNPNNKIPMVTVEGDELTTLQDNTWGLALDNEPTAKDNKVYKALSTDQTNPTLITDKDYEETPANDTTTIYYGFYITPDMPVGTYVGDGEVVYDAIPNLATVTFDANGLYYNNDESLTTNTIGYKPNVAEAPIELVTGEYLTPAPLNPDSSSSSIHYTFLGWSKTEGAITPDYEDEEDIITNLTLSPNEDLTLYAVWHYNTVLSFNGNTSDGGEPIADITIPAGTTITLPPNTFTKEDYIFASWNTKADGTGDTYPDQGTYIAPVSESQNVTLYAQWTDCAPNSICYNDNGANSPTTMDPQSASSNTDVELWASNYKYDTNNDGHNDYGFAGWSEDKDAATKLVDNDSTNNPVVYGPNQTITTGDLSTAGMKLYAVWIAPEQNTSFQAFTCPTNEDMPIGTIIALKDNRDNEVYTVAKLADGNCWMTENLRLDNNATINAANTNNPISTFTALSPSSNSWCAQDADTCFNQSKLNTNNIANPVSPMTGTDANIYSYSNYYNWYSATAGNGTRETSNNQVTAGDICPAGWQLPYGGSGDINNGKGNTSGGFYYLNNILGNSSNAWRSFPNNFVYSGGGGSSAYDRGSRGYYWSSTAGYTSSAYFMSFTSGNVGPGTVNGYKSNGISVRCVAPVDHL